MAEPVGRDGEAVGDQHPSAESDRYISPRDAFLRPTRGTSVIPISSKKRTYSGLVMLAPSAVGD